jgi:hypothetical protein
MSQSNKKSRFEKKVLAELTGQAKHKAEGIEIAARAIVDEVKHNDDATRGQLHALEAVMDELKKLSLPRAIAFLDKAIDGLVRPNASPFERNNPPSHISYTRGELTDWRKSYGRELSEMLARGPVPPEKPRERVYAFLIPRG